MTPVLINAQYNFAVITRGSPEGQKSVTQISIVLVLQREADLLKSIRSGQAGTKVVALGIGDQVDESELRDIASSPGNRTVILVQDFNSLPLVENQLRIETCTGMVTYE